MRRLPGGCGTPAPFEPVGVRRALGVLVLCAALVALAGCDFQRDADAKFGDQYFKTVIALIELHKVRTGQYPAALSELEFLGDWDPIALHSVSYRRLASGYELELTRGWIGQPELKYPKEFWQGLGLVQSNVKSSSDTPFGSEFGPGVSAPAAPPRSPP
jgi:hypothetical protein